MARTMNHGSIVQVYIRDRDKSSRVSTSPAVRSTSTKKFQSIVFQSSNKNLPEEEIEQLSKQSKSHSSKPSSSTMSVLNVMRRHTILCVAHAVALICIMIVPWLIDILPPETPKFWIGVTLSLVETHIVFFMFPCGKFMYQTVCYVPHQILAKCTSSQFTVNSVISRSQKNNDTITPTQTKSRSMIASAAVFGSQN